MANYDRVAQHLRAGEQDVTDAFVPIGYPAFLAILYKSSSRNFVVVGIAQAICGGLTCLLVWLITLQLTQSDLTALVAEAVAAVYPPLIYYGSMLLTESIAPFWMTLAVYLLIRASNGAPAAAALAGIALAVATLIRPNLLIVYPFVALVVCGTYWPNWRKGAGVASRILVWSTPLLLIASLNNSRLVGRPTGLSTNGGVNFFLAQADIQRLNYYDLWLAPIRNLLLYTRVLDAPVPFDQERYFYREGLKEWLRRPDKVQHATRNILEGFGLGVQGYWPANRRLAADEGREREYKTERLVLRWSSRLFFWVLVVPLAAEFALLIATRRLGDALLRVSLAASVVIPLAITSTAFLADPRIHIAFDPVLLALVAAALQQTSAYFVGDRPSKSFPMVTACSRLSS